MLKRVKNKTLIIEVDRSIIFDIIAHSNIEDLPLKKIKLINYTSWFSSFLMGTGIVFGLVWGFTDYLNGYGWYCLILYLSGYIIYGLVKTYATTLVEKKILEDEDYYIYIFSLTELKKEPIKFIDIK